MDSLIKWFGPGALVGGLGAAMLCGAGQAGADTGNDAGPAHRGAQSSASAPGTSTGGAEKAVRKPWSGSAGAASRRLAEAPASPSDASPSSAALIVPSSRVSAAAVVLRTSDNKSSATSEQRPAAAVTVPAPAAAAATVPVVPSSVPVDPAQFAGTYYEQGSVKQFFSIGLVNTKAVYTAKPDGTLGVRNSGNYFFKWGPKSSITGSAVPVNATNTALNVGFGGAPSTKPPGNYLILDRAPDYNWVIVSDPSGRSGYILTRSQTIDPKTYQELLAKARALGVQGRITPTRQVS